MSSPDEMWQCQTANCGYIYDPDRGDRKGHIPKGTKFEDLPDDWKCPVCGAANPTSGAFPTKCRTGYEIFFRNDTGRPDLAA